MPALDQAALILQHANLYVGDDAGSIVDLGALRNLRFTTESAQTKVNSDNRGTVVNKKRPMGVVECEWLESGDIAKIVELFKGVVARTTTAGTPVAGATQALESPFVANKFYEIANQNGDGTVPTINSVTGATDGALTAQDDYFVVQNPNTGRWGIVLNTVAGGTNLSTLSQVVTIDYDYTPNASQTLTGGSSQTATSRYVRIEAPDEDDSNKKRVIILEDAIVTSEILWQFLNVEDAGDVGVMSIRIESNKATTFTMTDQINPS